MIDYSLEHIFTFSATLINPPEMIGPVPEGLRVNFYVSDGEVTGPAIQGKIRPVGGDWITLRRDGVALLDVRATLETGDGALILMTYPGVIDLGPEGGEKGGRIIAKGTPEEVSKNPASYTGMFLKSELN